jgi:hypothetical protein
MKKYLLTVIGNFESKKTCEDFIKALTPLVDSKHVKYQHLNQLSLIHFGSEVPKDEIYDFLIGLFYGFTDTFILSEITDNMTYCSSDENKAHLLDLDNPSDKNGLEVKNINYMLEQPEDVEEFVSYLLEEMQSEIKIPSLNQILDKITENGISSLSKFEKEILDEYSKN